MVSQIRTSKRYDENGNYNNKPNDPEYFKKYYHLKLSKQVACCNCGAEVTSQKMSRHQKSKKCQERIQTRYDVLDHHMKEDNMWESDADILNDKGLKGKITNMA